MQSQATFQNVHITPKKLRFLLDDVKSMTPVQAMEHLLYSPRKSARMFYKAIKSVVDSAVSLYKVPATALKFSKLTVDEGNVLKRFRPGGRGTAKPYKKRYAHITVGVEADVPVQKKAKKPAVKTEKTVTSTAAAKIDTKEALKVNPAKKTSRVRPSDKKEKETKI